MVRVWCGTTPHVRRLSCGRSILYDSCVVTLNFACLPAVKRLFSRGPSEPDSTASEVILSSLYADSGGGVNKPSNGSALCAQELTLAAWNETNAPFVNKKCIVELVCILCTEAGHPFIFAKNALGPINDHVSFVLHVPVEGGPGAGHWMT